MAGYSYAVSSPRFACSGKVRSANPCVAPARTRTAATQANWIFLMDITPEYAGGLTTSGRTNAGKWLHALYRADKKEGLHCCKALFSSARVCVVVIGGLEPPTPAL